MWAWTSLKARSESDGPGLTLKSAHQLLRSEGVACNWSPETHLTHWCGSPIHWQIDCYCAQPNSIPTPFAQNLVLRSQDATRAFVGVRRAAEQRPKAAGNQAAARDRPLGVRRHSSPRRLGGCLAFASCGPGGRLQRSARPIGLRGGMGLMRSEEPNGIIRIDPIAPIGPIPPIALIRRAPRAACHFLAPIMANTSHPLLLEGFRLCHCHSRPCIITFLCFPNWDAIMEHELVDRAEAIQQRILQLRDSL